MHTKKKNSDKAEYIKTKNMPGKNENQCIQLNKKFTMESVIWLSIIIFMSELFHNKNISLRFNLWCSSALEQNMQIT